MGQGTILIVTAGTSDLPIAEEAAETATAFGNRIARVTDVGVAGLHRVLGSKDALLEARVIIVVAGMDGALPSVVAGLVSVPVIAVPTSIGYGASFGGIAALLAMNVAGHGRFALSPYGNVFLLARVIYDGPGMMVLRRECPGAGWRLCPYLDHFPPSSDDFLWQPASPVMLAGGHKAVSADADAIIHAALRAAPGQALRAAWSNALEQLTRFESGDGLEAWPLQVSPRIEADFPPREQAAYRDARQQRNDLEMPSWLAMLHRGVALAGIAAALVLLPLTWRRGHPATLFLAVALLTLPVSATITGALSTPHDRYQSRVVWLPACVVFLTLPLLFRRPKRGVQEGSPGGESRRRARRGVREGA